MADFWRDSGYHLLARRDDGQLTLTGDFLRAYLGRPELRPSEESCGGERDLHAALMQDPREAVAPARLEAIVDPDARENYRIFLNFRDRLAAEETIEGCYLKLFMPQRSAADGADHRNVPIPPSFVDHLAHVILRSILEGCEDGLRARSAELLFREQTVLVEEGAIMVADAETVEFNATIDGAGASAGLVTVARNSRRSVDLDVLEQSNAALYWDRSERYDTVLNLSFAAPGLDALCRVLEAWIGHFLSLEARIHPVQKISDEKWIWHIGLDAEGTKILNDLYNGIELDEARLVRLLGLFRLELPDPSVVLPEVAGRPVYLAMAMTSNRILCLKPQNLLVNLPLAKRT